MGRSQRLNIIFGRSGDDIKGIYVLIRQGTRLGVTPVGIQIFGRSKRSLSGGDYGKSGVMRGGRHGVGRGELMREGSSRVGTNGEVVTSRPLVRVEETGPRFKDEVKESITKHSVIDHLISASGLRYHAGRRKPATIWGNEISDDFQTKAKVDLLRIAARKTLVLFNVI